MKVCASELRGKPPAVSIVTSAVQMVMVTVNAHKPSYVYEPSKSTGLLLLVISLALVAVPIVSIVRDLRETPEDLSSASSYSLGVLLPLTVVPTLVLLIVRWIGLGLYLRN